MEIRGTEDADVLVGTDADETIFGLGGADTIYTNGGSDTVYGGAGDDTMHVVASGGVVDGEAGSDTFVAARQLGTGFVTRLDGGSGVDTLDFRNYAIPSATHRTDWYWNASSRAIDVEGFSVGRVEVLLGAAGRNVFALTYSTTKVVLHGAELSDEFLTSSTEATVAYGYGGDDRFVLTSAGGTADGGAGNDVFELSGLTNTVPTSIVGGAGVDTVLLDRGDIDLSEGVVRGSAGAVITLTGIENALVITGAGSRLAGTDGDNVLAGSYGSTPTVQLFGRGGNDTLRSQFGDDVLDGGDGDDLIMVRGGADTISGGSGHDTLSFVDNYLGQVTVALRNRKTVTYQLDDGRTSTLSGIEDIVGADVHANNLTGDAGANRLTGGRMNDVLSGWKGDDVLIGNIGSDRLTGGPGADQFVFENESSIRADRDVITDFNRREGDKIVLNIDADIWLGGKQDLVFIKDHAFTRTPGEVRFSHYGTQTLVIADTDGDAWPNFVLVLDGILNLKATDFIM